MSVRHTPAELVTSTTPILHCCETWIVRAREGLVIANRPTERATWAAIEQIEKHLLQPLEERYGVVTLTYGFAGRELVKHVQRRAADGGWLPNISPKGDQHAGHELNSHGNRICKSDGIAVDLRVPGESSEDVAAWVADHLPFDRMYLYGADKPFHLSWAPRPSGQVVRMWVTPSGRLMPRVIVKGRSA
jgi:hypothetical protein